MPVCEAENAAAPEARTEACRQFEWRSPSARACLGLNGCAYSVPCAVVEQVARLGVHGIGLRQPGESIARVERAVEIAALDDCAGTERNRKC